MGIYLESGYINMDYAIKQNCPLTIIIGGRATGKTFGALQYSIEKEKNIIFMRRTQSQTDLINKPEFSPINPVAQYMHKECVVKPISKYNSSIAIDDQIIGYTAALSTFSNLRGFDSSHVDLLIYDEFIPESHERPIKAEGEALLNVYESVNRNRELDGRKPLQMLLLSNANTLNSPVLEVLNLTRVVEKMRSSGRSEYINPDKGIALFLLHNSPISKAKENTALYKMVGDSNFREMSLNNDFAFDDLADIRSLPLTGWKLLAQIGEYYLYKKDGRFYLSSHCAGTPKKVYTDTEIDKRNFLRENPSCYTRILTHRIIYENFSAKNYLTSLYI